MTIEKEAILLVDDQKYSLAMEEPVLGKSTLHTAKLGTESNLYTYDPGFRSTASCRSAITFIDGQSGLLLHRGYAIQELAEQGDYLDTSFALLFGDLPNKQQKNDFLANLQKHSVLEEKALRILSCFEKDAHPMGMLLTLISAFSTRYTQKPKPSLENLSHMAFTIMAKMPIFASLCLRHTEKKVPILPNPFLSYTENFFNMLLGKPGTENDPILVQALDRILTLHADHEQNASTSAVRVTGSTDSNPFACIASGIATLWGPLHGGANEACLTMLEEIGSPDQVEKYIQRAKDKTDPFRLMGFGHRIYRNYDPRAKIMQETCHAVLKQTKQQNTPLFELALALEEHALCDPYFKERQLYPNVDFYSGITLRALGIPSNMFTVIFAVGRTVGWLAHWIEMSLDKETALARPRQFYNGQKKRPFLKAEERKSTV